MYHSYLYNTCKVRLYPKNEYRSDGLFDTIPNLYTSERLSLRVFEQFEIDFGRCDMFMSQHFTYSADN